MGASGRISGVFLPDRAGGAKEREAGTFPAPPHRAAPIDATVLPRPRLERILDGALTHRLTLVTGDSGFGKTTLLSTWSAGLNAVTHSVAKEDAEVTRLARRLVDVLRLRVPGLSFAPATEGAPGPEPGGDELVRPEAMAEWLGEALAQRLTRDLALVIDNAHALDEGPPAHFLANLVRHAPPLLHVVLAGRRSPPVPHLRMSHVGQVVELHGADLAFTRDEVGELLEALGQEADRELVRAVHDATAGWPVAVRLTLEAVRRVDPSERVAHLALLNAPRERLTALLEAVYQREPAAARDLLDLLAVCGEVPVELCEALGHEHAEETLANLARRGLFVERTATGWYRLQTSAREFVSERGAATHPVTADQSRSDLGARDRIRRSATDWLVAEGYPDAGLRLLSSGAPQPDAVAALLRSEGARMVAGGHALAVLRAIDELPPSARDADLERLAGEAAHMRGDWQTALDCYERAAAGAQTLDPGLAWRMGLIHHLRGELDAALAVYERGRIADDPSPDAALLLAWKASVHWLRSDREACADLAVRSLSVAAAVGDDQALAAAHTVLAMLAALDGDRRANDAHYIRALEHAEDAGDTLQRIRIHINRSSHHAEEGAYPEALAELDVAIRLADVSGFASLGALALCNRGETLLRLGRLEEALRDLEDAVAMFESLQSRLVAYPLGHLGALHHLRGQTADSRAAYERALTLAEVAGDQQGQVPALAGLARLTAENAPDEAAAFARRAIAAGEGMSYVAARLASARVALAQGDRHAALADARTARNVAEQRRDRAGLAESIEIEATATAGRSAMVLAERAIELWQQLGDPIGRARAELVRAERLDRGLAGPLVRAVQENMDALGCRSVASRAAAALDTMGAPRGCRVRIETLGGFRVSRARDGVGVVEWKSRKAVQLLKVLVSRRGRPVAREWLMEVLWPGEAAEGLANRLSVALSAVRSALDDNSDGEAGSVVVTDGDAVRLLEDRVEIDVESFLDDADAGSRLLQEGRETEALEHLRRAEATYGGAFLESDLYEDWAVGLREEARFAYVQVASRLAEHARRSGDVVAAVRYLLRVLEADPYDEPTHLELIATLTAVGRHGDARRQYRTYSRRMDELGVEAAPFPSP